MEQIQTENVLTLKEVANYLKIPEEKSDDDFSDKLRLMIYSERGRPENNAHS